MICKDCGNIQGKKKIGKGHLAIACALGYFWFPLSIAYIILAFFVIERKCGECGGLLLTKKEYKYKNRKGSVE